MDILLTFTGFHDPYFKGLVGQDEQPGPILSLLSARNFDQVKLFATPNTDRITKETKGAILSLYPDTKVDIFDLNLADPTDYAAILRGLRTHIKKIQDTKNKSDFYIALASGTPQMHACWVLLAAAGEIPAKLLNVRPPQFVTKDQPLITEIDPTSQEFPTVRSLVGEKVTSENGTLDFSLAVLQLGIVGDHPTMRQALESGALLAPSNAPVLILGETGTGKELIARFIHGLSGREKDRFIIINCAAIPGELVESLLFGHKRGAFTGATDDQTGKFDLANKGSLFLDEIGDLPVSAQAKLLRIIQDGLLEPIGAKKPHKVDVRIIAATNRDIRRLVRQGKFREDLFYRLNVGEIRLPSLRDRRSDIPKLALYILDRINSSLKRPKRLSPGALARLQAHSWPGNVRDMENVIERSARLCRHDVLDGDDLLITDPVTYADPLDTLPEPSRGFSLEGFLGSARKQLILRALEATGGKQSEAARLLGITPQAVHKFLIQSRSGLNRR